MKTNVGGMDRIARISVGLVLIGLAATGTVGVWGWLGIVPLATAAMGWCPAYTLLGINPHKTYMTPSGQAVPLVAGGKPIEAVVG